MLRKLQVAVILSLLDSASTDQCPHTMNVPGDDVYREVPVPALGTRSSLVFKVRACKDAQILLSSSLANQDDATEIVFGGSGNKQTVVRNCTHQAMIGWCDIGLAEGEFLNCSLFRTFWIFWGDSGITVGTKSEIKENVIVTATSIRRVVNHISVAMYSEDSPGTWIFDFPEQTNFNASNCMSLAPTTTTDSADPTPYSVSLSPTTVMFIQTSASTLETPSSLMEQAPFIWNSSSDLVSTLPVETANNDVTANNIILDTDSFLSSSGDTYDGFSTVIAATTNKDLNTWISETNILLITSLDYFTEPTALANMVNNSVSSLIFQTTSSFLPTPVDHYTESPMPGASNSNSQSTLSSSNDNFRFMNNPQSTDCNNDSTLATYHPITTGLETSTANHVSQTPSSAGLNTSRGFANCRCILVKMGTFAEHLHAAEEAQRRAEAMSKDLILNRKFLSAQTRRLNSAKDKRQSSQAMGSFGATFLVMVFSLLILSDVMSVISKRFLH